MRLVKNNLTKSVLRKEILREINYILKHYKNLNESARSTNLNGYLEAARAVLQWAKINDAYKIKPEEYYGKSTEEFDAGEFGEEYQQALENLEQYEKNADYNSDASEEFLNYKDLFLSAPKQIVNYANIIISDENREYWSNVDGTPRWTKNSWVGRKDYPKGGLWKIALAISGFNFSSRSAIQDQGILARSLTYFTYLPDDWKNVKTLWDGGHKREAIMAFLDMFSIFDISGLSDILGGILLLTQGIIEDNEQDKAIGVLMIGMGGINLALLVSDIVSLGATTPIHGEMIAARTAWHGGLLGLRESSIIGIEKLAYNSTKKIKMLQISKSQGNRMAGEFLEQASLRAQEVLEKKSKDKLTIADVEYITGKSYDDLLKTKFVDPVSAADKKLIYELAKPKLSVAGAAIQAPMAVFTFSNYFGADSWEETSKRAFSRDVYDMLKNMCREEQWKNGCSYLTYDYETMTAIPRKNLQQQQLEKAQRFVMIANANLLDKIKKSNLVQKYNLKTTPEKKPTIDLPDVNIKASTIKRSAPPAEAAASKRPPPPAEARKTK